jgi:N-acyl-D-aspartate/D-glutamate deacylase
VRDLVMGWARRPPTSGELEAMRRQVRLGFEAGARTLSFGLIYMPGAFSETEELVELAKEAALPACSSRRRGAAARTVRAVRGLIDWLGVTRLQRQCVSIC